MKHRLRTRSSKRTSAFTVIVTFLALSLMGLAIIPLLPVKLNPSRTLPSLTVDFTMTGASARVVEIEVTAKLEAMLARIKGIKNMSSTSANGWGRITLELDKHTRPDAARFEASTIVRQAWAGLPPETGYPVVRLNQVNEAAARPFMTFTVNAPANPILIQRYAEEHIKMRLAQLADIYQITVSGATPMEWRLEYNSKWLQQWGITVSDIRTAVQQHYEREALGLCRTETPSGGQEWIRLFLASDEAATSFDASKIRVAVKDGKVIYLNELVTTTYREQEPTSYYRINGLNSIYLSITSTDNANQLELSTRIHTIMNEIRAGLPAGYEIHTGYDATEYIRTELDKIYFRTAITVAILLLFVLLITLSPRYLFLITVSLSVNMAVAFIFYYLFRLEIQLYSLAGITISLSLIIDNTIVMADHYLRKRTLKVFLSILAATLTTIGALAIIFFLDEEIRVNLQDFAAVVIINMAVSLFVALFLVPAMIDKIGLQRKVAGRKSRWLLRGKLYFNHFYGWLIVKLKRWRVAVFTVFVFAFGLPVFLIPDDIGSNAFREKVRPVIEKIFGGTLRLFVDKVYNGSYFTRNEEVVLSAYASLPQGYTLEQMNTLIKRMETFLTGFSEIKQFQTTISSANQARIFVYFKEEHQRDGFPYRLKSAMIQRALQWGGGSWNISGLEDMGFSNDVRESAGSFGITLYGYNYDELYRWAEAMRDTLTSYRRIRDVLIRSELSYYRDDYMEFFFGLDKQRMAQENLNAVQLFGSLHAVFDRDIFIGNVVSEQGNERIMLSSVESRADDVWMLGQTPLIIGDRNYKLGMLAQMDKQQAPQEVVKENQQYRLILQYEYVGAHEQGINVQKREVDDFNAAMPIGYHAEGRQTYSSWRDQGFKPYLLLGVIIVIIFFTTAILFNSFKQPLAILFIIPVSYIGIFLTFYLFQLNFDQGGFASFVLLCGLTINAGIYILNEYNSIRRSRPRLSPLRAYIKAWNAKIVPIFLTTITTILGFIPFMVGSQHEAFWFPMAAGTIGGLTMSFVGVFILLPMLTRMFPRQRKPRVRRKRVAVAPANVDTE